MSIGAFLYEDHVRNCQLSLLWRQRLIRQPAHAVASDVRFQAGIDTRQRRDIRALVAGKVIECGASRLAAARILLAAPATTTRRPVFNPR